MRTKLTTRNLRANRRAAQLARQDGLSRRMHNLAWATPLTHHGADRLALFVRIDRRGPDAAYGYKLRYMTRED